MHRRLIDVLACPACGGAFALAVEAEAEGEVRTGRLACAAGHAYPVREFVPRFVPQDAYAASFSFEWRAHRRTQLDSANQGTRMRGASRAAFAERVDFPLESLRGRLVLDVGCGAGRYAEVASDYGAEVVAVDLSYAVDSARENLRGRPGVHVIQADVFALPLKPGTFDVIYSFGVLHHTPDAARAFAQLPRLLKPGGALSLFVYSAYNKAIVYSSACWRALTTRLPRRLLYVLCFVAVPLYYLYRLPVLGRLGQAVLVIPMWPDWRWRVLDMFDWYGARHQSKHTHAEVDGWFRQAGLRDLKIFKEEVTLMGRKPEATAWAALSSS